MILEEETFEIFGYYSKELKGHTLNLVIAACELCGKFRISSKTNYKPFCPRCLMDLEVLSKRILKKRKQKRKNISSEKKLKKEIIRKTEKRKKQKQREKEEKEEYKKRKEEEKKLYWNLHTNQYGEYCDLFNEEYKRKIRERYGNSCFLCGKWKKDNGRALDVHHVNYDKSCGCNGVKCICVPLCRSCHSKTNTNREYWERKIIRLIEEDN